MKARKLKNPQVLAYDLNYTGTTTHYWSYSLPAQSSVLHIATGQGVAYALIGQLGRVDVDGYAGLVPGTGHILGFDVMTGRQLRDIPLPSPLADRSFVGLDVYESGLLVDYRDIVTDGLRAVTYLSLEGQVSRTINFSGQLRYGINPRTGEMIVAARGSQEQTCTLEAYTPQKDTAIWQQKLSSCSQPDSAYYTTRGSVVVEFNNGESDEIGVIDGKGKLLWRTTNSLPTISASGVDGHGDVVTLTDLGAGVQLQIFSSDTGKLKYSFSDFGDYYLASSNASIVGRGNRLYCILNNNKPKSSALFSLEVP